MYPTRFLKATIAFFVLLTPQLTIAQQASDVFGTWKASAETEGSTNEYTWVIKKSENQISGKVTDHRDDETYSIKDAKLDGKNFSYSIDFDADGTPVTIKVEMELKSKSKMTGTYSAVDQNGNELASGDVEATKMLKALAGKWNSISALPDGNEMESAMTLSGDNADLAGFVTNQGGKNEFKNIVVKDQDVQMDLEVNFQGGSMLIRIKGKQEKDDLIVGKWIRMQDGEEAESGDWEAIRIAEKSKALFDGSSLDHFRGYASEKIGDGWKIVDGTLHLTGEKRSGDLVTKQQFENFELEFQWKVSEGGNSGVMYHVALDQKRPWHTGPEYQILDNDVHKDGKSKLTSAGSIYALYPPTEEKLKPVGEWNSTKIVLNKNKLEHWLNGTMVAKAEIGSDDWNAKVAKSKFSKFETFGKKSKGHIIFQDHGDPVWFKDIKIKSLDD